MKVAIRIAHDLRTPEQINRGAAIQQDMADIRLEYEFQRRVRLNIARRRQTNPNFARVV